MTKKTVENKNKTDPKKDTPIVKENKYKKKKSKEI